jgi:hypothetical protein
MFNAIFWGALGLVPASVISLLVYASAGEFWAKLVGASIVVSFAITAYVNDELLDDSGLFDRILGAAQFATYASFPSALVFVFGVIFGSEVWGSAFSLVFLAGAGALGFAVGDEDSDMRKFRRENALRRRYASFGG